MGWTYYRSTEYKNGKIDRLAECRKEFSNEPGWAAIVKDSLLFHQGRYQDAINNF